MATNILTQPLLKRSKRRINSEINVTPFVDVMLVLLVIFMVTSPMLISGVQVDLPKTKSSPLSGQDEPVAITIDKNGYIYIQETKVDISDLSAKLKAILGEKTDTRIFVRGDQKVDYGRVVKVFSSIKEAGFSNVALVTETNSKNH
jgi:biopolymer transport protein TolR